MIRKLSNATKNSTSASPIYSSNILTISFLGMIRYWSNRINSNVIRFIMVRWIRLRIVIRRCKRSSQSISTKSKVMTVFFIYFSRFRIWIVRRKLDLIRGNIKMSSQNSNTSSAKANTIKLRRILKDRWRSCWSMFLTTGTRMITHRSMCLRIKEILSRLGSSHHLAPMLNLLPTPVHHSKLRKINTPETSSKL